MNVWNFATKFWTIAKKMTKKLGDNFLPHTVDTALLEWLSEHAIRAYTTPDSSSVSYLNNV